MQEVFIFAIQDAYADWWRSEVAVVANSRQEARGRLRQAGLHKKQILGQGRPVRSEPLDAWDVLQRDPTVLLRRPFNDDGCGPWEAVPAGVSLDWRVRMDAQRHHPKG